MTRLRRWPVLIALVGLVLLAVLLNGLVSSRPPIEVPDYGGVYTEAVVGRPRSLSPIFVQTDTERDLTALLFRGLMRPDAGGVVVPDAAATWDVSADGLRYTFSLRDDVFWSDGVRVTSEDVLFTIRCVQDPAYTANPDVATFWRTVAMEAPDDKTVVFHLTEPFAPFLDQTTLGLLPAHVLGKTAVADLAASPFNLQPIGNGPFKLEKFEDMSVTLAPNPYDGGRRPYLARLTFRFYPDRAQAVEAYVRKEVMGVGQVAPADLVKVSNGALYSAPRPTFTVVYLNLDRFIFQDKRTRQALLLALNRPALIRQALNGQALVADSPILPQSWAAAGDLPHYAYDPTRAAALLEQVGWKDSDGDGIRDLGGQPFDFTLVTTDEPARVAVAQILAQQWAAVGVRARVQTVNARALESVYFDTRLFDAALYGWSTTDSDPDPYPFWHSTQVNEGKNIGGWANLDADSRLEQARQTPDPAVRAQLYREFQSIFTEEVPALLLYHGVYHYAVDPQVHNVQVGQVILDPSGRFQTIQQWYLRTRTVRRGWLGS